VVDKSTHAKHLAAGSSGHICDYHKDDAAVTNTPNKYQFLDYKDNVAYFHEPGSAEVSGNIVSEGDIDYDIQKTGSMFNDMSIKLEVFATPGGEHTLKAPTQDWNYLKNTTNQVQSFFPH